MDTDRSVGAYIRDKRVAAGISLRDAAQRIGVSHVFLGEIERGRKPLPQKHWAVVVSSIPGVSIEHLTELSSDDKALQLTLREAGPKYENIGQLLMRRAQKRDLHDRDLQHLLQLLRGDDDE